MNIEIKNYKIYMLVNRSINDTSKGMAFIILERDKEIISWLKNQQY